MTRITIAVLLPFFLVGCTDKYVVERITPVVVTPTEEMYNCPVLEQDQLPTKAELEAMSKDRLIEKMAEVIAILYTNNTICANSRDGMREFFEQAKLILEQKAD